jgi:hypothetical protein
MYGDNYAHRLRAAGPEVTPHDLSAPPEAPRLDRSLYESPVPTEPGSYTMIIGGGARPVAPPPGFDPYAGYSAPPPPPPPAANPPAPKAKSNTLLVVMLVLILAVLLTLVLFLALRPGA